MVVLPPLAAADNLCPALSLASRIVAVKGIRAGEGIDTDCGGPRSRRRLLRIAWWRRGSRAPPAARC
jgi:hypothetical protein